MKNTYIIPPPHFLKINDASTASHAENKCSTYHFRHGRRCLHAASSLYNKLEVQEYTRTYIFERIFALFLANSLYLHRLFPKGFFLQYTAHLLRRIGKSIHPCTFFGSEFRQCRDIATVYDERYPCFFRISSLYQNIHKRM